MKEYRTYIRASPAAQTGADLIRRGAHIILIRGSTTEQGSFAEAFQREEVATDDKALTSTPRGFSQSSQDLPPEATVGKLPDAILHRDQGVAFPAARQSVGQCFQRAVHVSITDTFLLELPP